MNLCAICALVCERLGDFLMFDFAGYFVRRYER